MDDLISEFITETTESLQMLDSELVKLEQDPSNEAILGNIFRLVHTIKGTCGFLGLPRLEAVAHAGENVLGKVRDKVIVVSEETISLVLEALDAIKSIVEYLSNHGEEPQGDDADLTRRLNAYAESNGGSGGGAASSKPSMPETASAEPVMAVVPVAVPTAPDPHPAAAAPDAEEVARKAKETALLEGLAAEARERETQGSSAANAQNQSIRVNLDVLENLMQMVSELVLTRNQLLQIVRTRNDPVFASPLQHLSHITSELQEGIMKTRMQPIGNAWSKFPRLIRDLSHELGKKIDLRMNGAETELDRQLLEMIKDPLTHMVRNSADHGLETIAERRAAGKPETGTVTLSAYHEGGHIIMEIADDGRGLNIERIKKKVVDVGLATASDLASLTDEQIMQFIFRPGFSTAEKVTSVSGRGVGMDVVRTNIEKIGGTIELSSVFGKGSKFTIKIPLTLAIVSVLIVESGGERFALPQINVQELVRVGGDSEHHIERVSNASVLRLRGKLLPLISLAQVLNLSPAASGNGKNKDVKFIAVCKVGGFNFGLIVDRVFDTEEIVVKPTSEILKSIPIYSGNTILGDGSVIMILDPNGLARSTGEQEVSGGADSASDVAKSRGESAIVNFLLFSTGTGAPKVVPLELVSRLEEIDMATVEKSGEHPVVQYRGELMRLRTLDPQATLPAEGCMDVIVFTYDGKTLGLVVEEIVDIMGAPYDIKLSSGKEGFLGSMVLDGKTTDVVDVAFLLKDLVGENSADSVLQNKQNQRVLLVDDSPFFRNLTIPFLASAGYIVTSAGGADEAMHEIEKAKFAFDVIVSDIEMPGIDGFGFAEMCQNHPRISSIPLFAFTSAKNERVMQRGREVGFRDIILKTDRAGLLQALADSLRDKQKESA